MKHKQKTRTFGCLSCSEEQVRRRDFLRIGSLGLLGISLGQFLQARSVMAAAKEAVRQGKAEACALVRRAVRALRPGAPPPAPRSV